MAKRTLTRRRYTAVIGAGIAAGLAGCADEEDPAEEEDPADGMDDDGLDDDEMDDDGLDDEDDDTDI